MRESLTSPGDFGSSHRVLPLSTTYRKIGPSPLLYQVVSDCTGCPISISPSFVHLFTIPRVQKSCIKKYLLVYLACHRSAVNFRLQVRFVEFVFLSNLVIASLALCLRYLDHCFHAYSCVSAAIPSMIPKSQTDSMNSSVCPS